MFRRTAVLRCLPAYLGENPTSHIQQYDAGATAEDVTAEDHIPHLAVVGDVYEAENYSVVAEKFIVIDGVDHFPQAMFMLFAM